MRRNSRESPLKRPEFHAALGEFLDSGRPTVGDAKFGQTAWVCVKHLGNRYYLNSDTSAEGVAAYLELVEAHGQDLKWSAIDNARGRANKAAFGPDQAIVEGFYLYRQL